MVNSDKSIFEYKVAPLIQVGAVLATAIVFMAVSELAGMVGIAEVDGGTPWLIICSMSFFYTIGNSVMSLSSDDQNTYWWQSMLGYMALVLIGGSIAYLFSGSSMDAFGTYRWLFVMFAMGHIFFLALVRTMRRIVAMAKEQDGRLRGDE